MNKVVYTIPGGETRLTYAQAAALFGKKKEPAKTVSHWYTEVLDIDGNLKWRSPELKHNLTTDSASGYTNRRDFQSKVMGGGTVSGWGATATGTLSAVTATTATNASAAFPTAGQGLSGAIVAVGPNSSGTGSTVFGVIVSNTATALTIDRWYTAATLAVGTTPNATGQYQILPGGMPAMFLAVTSDGAAASASDTTLASEATTNGFTRALATYAHTAAASTYTLTVTYTATGTLTVNKYANFGAANSTAGGVMPFESVVSSPPTLVSGDTLTLVVTITIN